MNVYEFQVKNQKGELVNLQDLKGKVSLIINSATGCGFTPQYEDLQALYNNYKDQGFEILDFPCNQFGDQAPGSNEEIATFCSSRFGITFPIFSKIDVNGENAEPLFAFLKEQKGFKGFQEGHPLTPVLHDILSKAQPNYKETADIKWNFTKFLIDKNGVVIERFEPVEDIKLIEERIKELV
ncbi:glutathione peroxidase [Anaerotignum sp.]|uniref:glutathione peroxidase n=1 Tax=Anaerotignum sp. TaxID=2039241 RepID=UPI0028A81920|nr:glutathione peroxidase [Anaerotignum sp.]